MAGRRKAFAAKYKHFVLGLVSLQEISDRFEDRRCAIEAPRDSNSDECAPNAARRLQLYGAATDLIVKENLVIRSVLPRNYCREGLVSRDGSDNSST